jgi:hypothetical protein
MAKYASDRMENEIELLKKDLVWQLSFQEIDWEYFQDTVRQAAKVQKKLDKVNGNSL